MFDISNILVKHLLFKHGEGTTLNMKSSFLTLSFVMLLLTLIPVGLVSVGDARKWVVDINSGGDFCSIQEAIDYADPGDIIEVRSGTFYEHLVIDKPISLFGENSNTTIIDGNRTGNVVTIHANNVYITGFTIEQSGENKYGVLLDGSNASTIRENIITHNYYGIWLNSSEENTVAENTVLGNTWGIYLKNSKNNTIEKNILSLNSRRALNVDSSFNNSIYKNVVVSNVEGVYLEFSGSNMLRNNTMKKNAYSFGVIGSQLEHFMHDVDTSNTIEDKPIYYWVNQRDSQIPDDAGFVAVVNSTGVTVRDLNLTIQQEGLLFVSTKKSIIRNVCISNARYGLRLISCEDIQVVNSKFEGNAKGIRLDYSVNNIIKGNVIEENHEGLFLDNSKENVVKENTIANNIRGIFIYYSTHNIIYHNNFINNEKHVFTAPAKILIINNWDLNGEGNYWSGHVSVEHDENGIGDTPFVLDGNNQDNHPLMGLFIDFTVLLEGELEHVIVICNSTISNFNFTDMRINFNVTVFEGATGFCRITIPHRLLNGSYQVLVSGSSPLIVKELPPSNSTHTVLYFTFKPSAQNVIIVPEYSWDIFTIFILVALMTFLIIISKLYKTQETLATKSNPI